MITFDVIKSTYKKDKIFRVQHDDNGNAFSLLIKGTIHNLTKNCSGGAVLSSNESVMDHCIENGIGLIGVDQIPPLDDGDIILYRHTEKSCCKLFNAQSDHNILFLTNRCNSNCIMCPQPPANDEMDHVQLAYEIISLINSAPPKQLTITGGEPTLHGESLIELISYLRSKMPETELNLLTNGRKLADYSYTSRLYDASEGKIMFAVPLYADSANLHDKIVNIKGAFRETISGLISLAALKAIIEVRIVLLKMNISRLSKLISWIASNLPFISHVAIMGAEPEGNARKVWSKIWKDPVDCHEEFKNTIKTASRVNVPIRFYNLQICTLPKAAWEFSYCSISDWKRIYQRDCNRCKMKSLCGGFFQSQDSPTYLSRGIAPVE